MAQRVGQQVSKAIGTGFDTSFSTFFYFLIAISRTANFSRKKNTTRKSFSLIVVFSP